MDAKDICYATWKGLLMRGFYRFQEVIGQPLLLSLYQKKKVNRHCQPENCVLIYVVYSCLVFISLQHTSLYQKRGDTLVQNGCTEQKIICQHHCILLLISTLFFSLTSILLLVLVYFHYLQKFQLFLGEVKCFWCSHTSTKIKDQILSI